MSLWLKTKFLFSVLTATFNMPSAEEFHALVTSLNASYVSYYEGCGYTRFCPFRGFVFVVNVVLSRESCVDASWRRWTRVTNWRWWFRSWARLFQLFCRPSLMSETCKQWVFATHYCLQCMWRFDDTIRPWHTFHYVSCFPHRQFVQWKKIGICKCSGFLKQFRS